MKTSQLTRRDLESLTAYYTQSHKTDKDLPYLERTFSVVTKFLNARGYEMISPELRISEARLLDANLHLEYMRELRRLVIAPVGATPEQAFMLVVMASPEDREKALNKIYSQKTIAR
jgi:hypothetical protein